MNEEHTLELNEWSFPEVDLGAGSDEIDLSAYFTALNSNEEEKSDAAEDTQEQAKQENQEENIKALAKQEIEQIRQNYEEKVQVINNLLNKLKNPASIIDEELVELIQDIVKKISKRIILKEIVTDPMLFSQMINELRTLIDSKSGMITVYLSAQDYHRLDTDKNHAAGLANIDNNLNEGDIVIKSNFAEVRALLDERIDQLIRIQHD